MAEVVIYEEPVVYREFLTYLLSIQGKSKTTIYEYSVTLKNFFRFLKRHRGLVPKDEPLNQIDISDLDIPFVQQITLTELYEYLSYVSANGNNAATRARKVSCLRSYFKFMTIKANYLENNPAKELDSPKLKQSLPKYLDLDESMKLLHIVEGPNQFRDYAILTLFLNCGMRLSELVGINLSDIKKDTLVVTGKRNKERVIYLNDACIHAIQNYISRERPTDGVIDKNALFLSSRKKRIYPKTVQWTVKKYLEKAGLDTTKYSTHKLRHTAATLMYKYGKTDLRTIQEILGHEQLSTTQIYTHVDDEQRREALKNNPLANL